MIWNSCYTGSYINNLSHELFIHSFYFIISWRPGLRDLWGPGIVLEIENTKRKEMRNFPSRMFLFMIVFLNIHTHTHTHTHTICNYFRSAFKMSKNHPQADLHLYSGLRNKKFEEKVKCHHPHNLTFQCSIEYSTDLWGIVVFERG